MAMILILASALSAAAPDCAAMAYCLSEARERFCEVHPNGLPAKLTPEEAPVHALVQQMEAAGCAVPEDRLACPAGEPARAAPPVDCPGIKNAAPPFGSEGAVQSLERKELVSPD